MLELEFYRLAKELLQRCARCEASWCGSECEEHGEES
jgi:hypothetical protein